MSGMRGNFAGFAARRRGEIGDVLLAAAVLAFTIPTTLMGRSFSLLANVPDWLELLAGVATAGAMLLRRRTAWPMIVGAVVCAVLTGQTVPLALAAYSMTAEDRVRRWQWVAVALTGVYVVADYVNPFTDQFLYLITVRALTLVYLPALVGTWVREYRSMNAELRSGVRLREQHAASQERRWIAGELHDTVTHAVTAMVLNAGVIQDTEDHEEIGKLATGIEDKGVQALTELRGLLTVLRREEVYQSSHGVEAIPRLVEEAKDIGLRVSLHLDFPQGALSPQLEHECYRVVQEGLNNVRKHAPGSDVRIVCEADGDVMSVSVVNTPHGRRETVRECPVLESGYGLAGLWERITLAGGQLESGPTPEGGYALTARIPFQPSRAGKS
ncbi:sensor histidine kinase [Sphaerisporangium sp. NPDC049003]|uniref:sensor histidine kinase n=1 Tax=Sphaerisporangium sp. NPDC049003 TaxID=3364517 RepID=UPI0037186DCE